MSFASWVTRFSLLVLSWFPQRDESHVNVRTFFLLLKTKRFKCNKKCVTNAFSIHYYSVPYNSQYHSPVSNFILLRGFYMLCCLSTCRKRIDSKVRVSSKKTVLIHLGVRKKSSLLIKNQRLRHMCLQNTLKSRDRGKEREIVDQY